ncbi:MAG: hypothetical protein L6Q68_18510, partial [Aquabacterium sp.]|nr:hypothetical protein [Aquabacterium sp.]
MSDVAKSESSTEQYWKDYLQWGGIVATTWQTSFKALKDGLDSGMIPLENLHTEAAKAFGRNYQFLSEKVIEWAAHVDSARGPLATAFAEEQRAQYIAEATALTDDLIHHKAQVAHAMSLWRTNMPLSLPR